MSDFGKLPWLGLAWLLLVGIVASVASERAAGMALWGPLLAAGAGWLVLTLMAARHYAAQTELLKAVKNDEGQLLDEFHALLEECSRPVLRADEHPAR
jgi:hypothetical protein